MKDINNMTGVWERLSLVIAVLLSIAGCYDTGASGFSGPSPTITGTPQPLPCAIFSETYWGEFGFGIDSPGDVIATVARLWAIDEARIQELEPEPEEYRPYRQVVWESVDGRAEYFAQFREGEPLLLVDIVLSSDPSLAQIIDCLGEPDYYSAYVMPDIEDTQLRLDLWYAERGLVVSHNSWIGQHSHDVSPISLALNMREIDVVAREDPAKMVSASYDWSNPGQPEYILCVLRPWPGSIEAIEIEETYPELSQCYEPM